VNLDRSVQICYPAVMAVGQYILLVEHFTTILPNGTIQIPPNMLKDLGFAPGMPIELHKESDILEIRPVLSQLKSNIYFGCMKDQIVMHDDLIAPADVDWHT
jgi:hypothetical protein